MEKFGAGLGEGLNGAEQRPTCCAPLCTSLSGWGGVHLPFLSAGMGREHPLSRAPSASVCTGPGWALGQASGGLSGEKGRGSRVRRAQGCAQGRSLGGLGEPGGTLGRGVVLGNLEEPGGAWGSLGNLGVWRTWRNLVYWADQGPIPSPAHQLAV